MKRLLFVLLVLLTLVVSCSPDDTTTTTTTTTSTTVTPSPTTTVTSTVPATTPGSLEQRLDLLVERLEDERVYQHVPGMALGVVKDDEVILLHGFGVADVEESTPVTPETIFPIGSTTKAFTSALVAMLVDEGKMSWDASVTEYLPYFNLNIDSSEAGARVTMRDVMSHRTGFTRMGLLFGSGQIGFEEVLHDAVLAEPYAPFRDSFYYSNVVFMSAGMAAAEVMDSSWDSLVTERILEPLGMSDTSTSITGIVDDPAFASGYLWDEDTGDFKFKPARNVDNIGPAGSINSTVTDMAEWLRLQLGKGTYDGRELISEENLTETWSSQIEIVPGIDYGLGWMIREWNGYTVIEHGGNVDGYSAEVAMIPEEELGFVLLTNAAVSPLQQSSLAIVWDTLLGEWTEPVTPGTDYSPYIGEYVADFASFDNDVFTVLVKNGRLAVDVPGQQVYTLKDPDEEGLWYFDLTSEIAVSFERNDDGDVIIMYMYQAGFVFELPATWYNAEPEIPLAELQPYLGDYESAQLGLTVRVLISHQRLAVDIPGEMAYELYPPDEEGLWYFRSTPEISISFGDAIDGRVETLFLHQSGMQFEFNRIETDAIPTVAEILALRDTEGRSAALDDMRPYRIEGTVRSLQSGVTGTITIYVAGDKTYRVDEDYGKYGHATSVVNGDVAWTDSSFASFEVLHGRMLKQAVTGHPETLLGDWRDWYETIEFVRVDELNGEPVYVLRLSNSGLPAVTVYVDVENGEVLKSESGVLSQGNLIFPVTTTYSGFAEVEGLSVPWFQTSITEESGIVEMSFTSFDTGWTVDDSLFEMEAAVS